MAVPPRNECLARMEEVCLPPHIREHCLVVATITGFLGCRLKKAGWSLDLPLLEAGALLHDIAKGRCIVSGENHAALGGQMVIEWGYSPVAPIVDEHVHIEESQLFGPVTESLIVNYADKRVRHAEIVSLEERFEDLIVRYAKTEAVRQYLRERLVLFRRLEEKILGPIGLAPEDLARLPLTC